MCRMMTTTVFVFWMCVILVPDVLLAQLVRSKAKRSGDYDNCLNKSPLDCSKYKCQYVNPRKMKRQTEHCYYDKLQGSCLCPREEAAVPCQVHSRVTCERSECPYAKKTGRARPNCVWNEHKGRCKSPEPSFFYMLTKEGRLYLTDPDDKTIKHVRDIENGISIASSIHTSNGLYALVNTKKFQNLYRFRNVYEDSNGTLERKSRLRDFNALGEGRKGEGDLFAGKQSEVYKFTPGKRLGNPLGRGQHAFAGDLATDPRTDKIYGLSEKGVFEVNVANGSHTDILVSLPTGTQYALGFTCDGRLWASGSNKKIYEVNVATRRSNYLMSLGVHTPIDFSSQPGC